MSEHRPVLLHEVVDMLARDTAGTYLDATFGRGGHARALLDVLGNEARLLVADRDPSAIAVAESLAAEDVRVEVMHAAFSDLVQRLASRHGQFAGLLFDLGVSSPQLDDASRGFSFRDDGPLDMRMNPAQGESAAEWLARAPEREISDVLWQLGEERRSRQIARRIVETRAQSRIETTRQLAELVRSVIRGGRHRIDPATRTFQAIRMQVNGELAELETALDLALNLVAPGGRIAVIAFHSLEDRIVKRRFRNLARAQQSPAGAGSYALVTRRPVVASEAEIATNPRARSARLRVLERAA